MSTCRRISLSPADAAMARSVSCRTDALDTARVACALTRIRTCPHMRANKDTPLAGRYTNKHSTRPHLVPAQFRLVHCAQLGGIGLRGQRAHESTAGATRVPTLPLASSSRNEHASECTQAPPPRQSSPPSPSPQAPPVLHSARMINTAHQGTRGPHSRHTCDGVPATAAVAATSPDSMRCSATSLTCAVVICARFRSAASCLRARGILCDGTRRPLPHREAHTAPTSQRSPQRPGQAP